MGEKNWIKKRIEKLRKSADYEKEQFKIKITEEISAQLKNLGMTKKDFATLVGKSPAYITKLLNGNNNFTVDTIFDIGKQLGIKFQGGYNLAGEDVLEIRDYIEIKGFEVLPKYILGFSELEAVLKKSTMKEQFRVSQNETVSMKDDGVEYLR